MTDCIDAGQYPPVVDQHCEVPPPPPDTATTGAPDGITNGMLLGGVLIGAALAALVRGRTRRTR